MSAFKGKEELAAEEQHVEGVLKLIQQAVQELQAKLKEVVHLRAKLAQQEQLEIEAKNIIEAE